MSVQDLVHLQGLALARAVSRFDRCLPIACPEPTNPCNRASAAWRKLGQGHWRSWAGSGVASANRASAPLRGAQEEGSQEGAGAECSHQEIPALGT